MTVSTGMSPATTPSRPAGNGHSRPRTRWWLLMALLIGLVSLSAAPRTPVAAQDDTSKLAVVKTTYDTLLDQFYRKLDPAEILKAGWVALEDGLKRNNLTAPPALPALPPGRDAAFATFTQHYRSYTSNLPSGLTPLDVAFAVADGMADYPEEKHTAFLPPASYRSFLQQLGGSSLPVGSGIRIAARAPYLITAVAPGGPAARAGVEVGDIYVAVDGKDVTTISRAELGRALAGEAGTSYSVTVDREGTRVETRVTRGEFYFPPLDSRILPGNVGYLRLDSFVGAGTVLPNGTELLSDLDRRLDEFDAAGVRGIVYDLRGNGGGSVNTTSEILGRFLPETALTVIRGNERGNATTGIVGGQMRAKQYPMVVMVNGGSASASEVSAATMKENNRAVLVGQKTAGALATSITLPVGEGAGLQVAIADIVTQKERFRVDEVGYPVDVEVADTRTAVDWRRGRDPQLDAAVEALAKAPAPPAVLTERTGVSVERLRSVLGPYFPDAARIPTTSRLQNLKVVQVEVKNHVNQYIGGDTRDPLATQAVLRSRGWLGSVAVSYGEDYGSVPVLSVSVDVYRDPRGAMAQIMENDFPEYLEIVKTAVSLGDGVAAYTGKWSAQGAVGLSWRQGNLVFGVGYGDLPGSEDFEVVAETARRVNELYLRNPLPDLIPVPLAAEAAP